MTTPSIFSPIKTNTKLIMYVYIVNPQFKKKIFLQYKNLIQSDTVCPEVPCEVVKQIFGNFCLLGHPQHNGLKFRSFNYAEFAFALKNIKGLLGCNENMKYEKENCAPIPGEDVFL